MGNAIHPYPDTLIESSLVNSPALKLAHQTSRIVTIRARVYGRISVNWQHENFE